MTQPNPFAPLDFDDDDDDDNPYEGDFDDLTLPTQYVCPRCAHFWEVEQTASDNTSHCPECGRRNVRPNYTEDF